MGFHCAAEESSTDLAWAGTQSYPQKLWNHFFFDFNCVVVLAACLAGIAVQPAPGFALAGCSGAGTQSYPQKMWNGGRIFCARALNS
jgi:hypothetical protein